MEWFEQCHPETKTEEEILTLFTSLKEKHPEVHRKFLVVHGFSHGHASPKWLGGGSDAMFPRNDKFRGYIKEVLKLLRVNIKELQAGKK